MRAHFIRNAAALQAVLRQPCVRASNGAFNVIGNGFAGTAILESDRPIVAIADVYTDVFTGDDDFVYNAIPLDQ